MILLDHQNLRAKLITLISILSCMIMASLATQTSNNASIHTIFPQTAYPESSVQKITPRSMAYFNPETGSFTTKPFTTKPLATIEEPSVIQAKSATLQTSKLQASKSQLNQDQISDSEPTERQTFKEYNNSFVIPAPRSLHSKLVAYRPSTIDIKNGANTIIYKHEEAELSQPEHSGL